MAQKRRDRRPAPEAPTYSVEDEEHREEGKASVWEIEPGRALVLTMWHDGETTCYIEEGECW